MKIHLPNSAFLGNLDSFLRGFDPTNPDRLEITANDQWIAVHPLVLSMIAALGLTVKPDNIRCEPLQARSGHYVIRMGLLKMLNIPSTVAIVEHEPDRKSTRLNSSHSQISYAVFCFEKK